MKGHDKIKLVPLEKHKQANLSVKTCKQWHYFHVNVYSFLIYMWYFKDVSLLVCVPSLISSLL